MGGPLARNNAIMCLANAPGCAIMIYGSEEESSLSLVNASKQFKNLTGKEASEMTYSRMTIQCYHFNHSVHRSPRSGRRRM